MSTGYLFLLLKLFFIMALAFQSDPALYRSCTVIRQSFCILKSPTYSNVVLVLLHHNSCHYFDDAVAVKDCFIQTHLSKKLVFLREAPFELPHQLYTYVSE